MGLRERQSRIFKVRETLIEHRARPEDPAAAVEVSQAWASLDKAKLAVAWAQKARFIARARTEGQGSPLTGRSCLAAGDSQERPTPADFEATHTANPEPSIPESSIPGPPYASLVREISRMAAVPEGGDDVDAQMQVLLGGNLFGSAGESLSPMHYTTVAPQPKRGASWRRLAVLSCAILLALGTVGIVQAGLAKKAVQRSQGLTRDLLQLLRTGAFEQVELLLPEAVEAANDADLQDIFRGVLLRTEATLFRYYDADPQRLQRIESMLAGTEDLRSYDVVIARALTTARVDRLALLGDLRKARSQEPHDPEAAFLIAAALSRAGAVSKADKAFQEAELIEASNLQHLAALASHHSRNGRALETEQVLERMRDISPESPLTALVQAQLDDLKLPEGKRSPKALESR